MWVADADLPRSAGHPFYERLNRVLDEAGFDAFVEEQCAKFYADGVGRRSLPPGRYFRNTEPSGCSAPTTAAPAEAMRELEASLEAHGLLENLVVRAHDGGKTFHAVGGSRRLQALRTLAKKRQSRFRTTTPIRCRVMPDDAIDGEISAVENMVRVNMHPVDQLTAFHKLLERGLSVREIANRFGLTARTMQRRLRLGGVSPRRSSRRRVRTA